MAQVPPAHDDVEEGMIHDIGFCTHICQRNLEFVGMNSLRGWNRRTVIGMFILGSTAIILIINLLTGIPQKSEVGLYIVLAVLNMATLVMMVVHHQELIVMAEAADTPFDYHDDKLNGVFEGWDEEPHDEWVLVVGMIFEKALYLVNLMIICLPLYQIFIKKTDDVSKLTLPYPMKLGTENIYVYLLVYFYQSLFMAMTALLGVFLVEIFTSATHQICIHYKKLCSALTMIQKTPATDEPVLMSMILHAIEHHIHIIWMYDELKNCFDTVFHFVYFGAIWAITLSRGILTSETTFMGMANFIGIMFVEIMQLFLYSLSMEKVIESSNALRTAVYNTNWYEIPVSCRRMLNTMFVRTIKPPFMSFHYGGAAVCLETFGHTANSTITYFLIVFIMARMRKGRRFVENSIG